MMRNKNYDVPTTNLKPYQRPQTRKVTSQLIFCFLLCLQGPTLSQAFPPELSLEDLLFVHGGDSTRSFVLNRVSPQDQAGYDVTEIGDINGDGHADFGVLPDGEYYTVIIDNAYVDKRHAYIVFGRANPIQPELNLEDLLSTNGGDGTRGFVLNGISPADAEFRLRPCISGAGDFNGDGLDDLIYGDPGEDGGRRGTVFVVFGRKGTFPPEFELGSLLEANGGNGSQGLILHSRSAGSTGNSVSAGGDVNGDGLDDILIGNAAASGHSGEAYVIFGRSTGFPPEIHLGNLFPWNRGDGTQGFVLKGIDDRFDGGREYLTGWNVWEAGDINNDGLADILLNAPGASPTGEGYVVFGRSDGFPPVIELADLPERFSLDSDGKSVVGFVLKHPVTKAGNLNGDRITESGRKPFQNSSQLQ